MMEFPDLPHLRKLSKALWSGDLSGNAAVMVGAGVSANARPADPSFGKFPTWGELTNTMVIELSEASQSSSQFPKSFPRIASEYEAAFGPKALHDLISESIPDLKFLPSVVHEKLLGLPWVDIFTTNYDTLLERTFVQGRSFHTVTKVADIARGSSPRIYKLHGSLPSETPLIITEEHFRTYPVKYAPFVNTVRQSMLENAFVLLGFSGDDPNFLEWSGWVRDQLGPEHCPIYLCGLLDLDTPKRKLLEARGVTPIDLSPPFDDLRNHPDRYEIALTRLLDALAGGEPTSPVSWPKTDSSPLKTEGVALLVKADDVAEGPSYTLPVTEETIIELYRRWNHERKSYPGWLVAPSEVRDRIWENTSHWISHIVDLTAKWSPTSRLLLLRELNWRLEVCHSPLVNDLIDGVDNLVEWFDSSNSNDQKFDAPEVDLDCLSSAEVGMLVVELQIALLRDARESFEFDRWGKIQEKIDDPTRNSFRLAYERILALLWQGLRQRARVEVKLLPICDSPQEKLQKASILAELDDLGSARHLAEEALYEIRTALRLDPESIRLLSREGWAIYLLMHVRKLEYEPAEQEFDRLSWKRFRELRLYDCDSFSIKSEIEMRLETTQPSIGESKRVKHEFDPLSKTTSHSFGSDLLKQFLPAFSHTRLFERAAIPLRTTFYNTAGGDAFRAALDWKNQVSTQSPHLLLIRRGDLKILNENSALTRETVALLPQTRFNTIYEIASGAFEDLLPTHNGRLSKGDLDSLSVAAEILSRLTLQMNKNQLDQVFEKCRRLYQSRCVIIDPNLETVTHNFFKRLLSAAQESSLTTWFPEILRLSPVPDHEQGTENEFYRREDPFCLIEFSWLEKFDPPKEVAEEVREEIGKLFNQLGLQSGERFRRTLRRLISLSITTPHLSKLQAGLLGNWIWMDGDKERDSPLTPGLKVSVALGLPHPVKINPSEKLKNNIWRKLSENSGISLGPDGKDAQPNLKATDDLLREICDSTAYFEISERNVSSGVRWNKTESKKLLNAFFEIWSRSFPLLQRLAPHSEKSSLFGVDRAGDFLRTATLLVSDAILPFLGKISKREIRQLETISQEISDLGGNSLEIKIGMLLIDSDANSSLEAALGEMFDATSNEEYATAAKALFRWGTLSETFKKFPPVPAKLVERVAHDLAFRLDISTETAFSFFISCIEQNRIFVSGRHIDILIQGLPGWELSTRLAEVGNNRRELSNFRFMLSRLIHCLLNTEKYASNSIVLMTSQHLKEDRLPEIRSLF